MAVNLPDAPVQTLPIVIHYQGAAPLTDEQLLKLSASNRNLRFERSAAGDLIIMTPTGGKSSKRNAEIIIQLGVWAKQDGNGVVFDSSGGFRLASSAIRSPDAAWVSREKLDALSDEDLSKYPPLCPEFIIELRSASDSLRETQDKMHEYIENGAKLGWLIDPEEQKVHIYTPEGVEILDNPEKVSGSDVLKGFELDVLELW